MTRKPVCCTIYTALVRFRRKSEFLPNLPIKYDHFAVMLHYFFQELWCHYSFTKRQYWNWNISYARCYQKFRPSCRNHRPSAHEHSLCYLYAYVGRLCQYSMSKNQNQIFGLCPSGRSSIFHLRNTICKIFKYCKVSCCQGEHSMMRWNLTSKKFPTETEYGVWKLILCSFTYQSQTNLFS